jgi:hypothetical protein
MNKKESKAIIPAEGIERSIYVIRGHKVILDQDLAALYGVETKNLNKAVNRNQKRFPEDFIFQLTKEEWTDLKFQFGTSSSGWGGRRKLPMAFTEHGVAMAANLLKSNRAIEVSVEIVRTFIRLREFLSLQKELVKELAEMKDYVLKNTHKTDCEFRRIWRAIEKLAEKPEEQRQIGFDLN